MTQFKQGGPTRSSCRTIWTPRWEVTFEPDATDDEIEAFLVRMGIRQPAEPIPDFAECGRPGCDLREKRMEHGHFGDREPRIHFVDRRSFARRYADSLVELFTQPLPLPNWFIALAVVSVIVAALIGWARS